MRNYRIRFHDARNGLTTGVIDTDNFSACLNYLDRYKGNEDNTVVICKKHDGHDKSGRRAITYPPMSYDEIQAEKKNWLHRPQS